MSSLEASQPVFGVLQRGDSFSRVWQDLAEAAGARVVTGPDIGALSPLSGACALLISLPGDEHDGPEQVTAARAAGAGAIAVIGTAAEHRLAVGAVRAGANEYFVLPADAGLLRAWVLEKVAAERARAGAQALAAEEQKRFDFSRLIGESSGVREAMRLASRIIPRGSATVLITGETGTGKEVLAHAIHHNGPRAGGPFVSVNCAALPANLLEAELFGYEKGAFTDARTAKAGLLEAAHGGTLFLDEIGDLPLELQPKLLRVLEAKEVRRLGSLRSLKVDVRIIAATHQDLQAVVASGGFREDLFFRLSVVPIHLPPLRERGSDVLLLAGHFLATFAEQYELPVPAISDEVRRALLAYPWPGNVRELRNALERAVLLGNGVLQTEDLFRMRSAMASGPTGGLPFPATLAEIERAAARYMVDRLEGNKSAAADTLGISRTRLYRLLDADV